MDPFEGKTALNYVIGSKLGEGAFGVVYRARHVDLGREVAIKILQSQHAAKPDLIERFLREARVVCEIGHPDIVTVENAGRLDSGEPFYLMELVEGRSLSRLVRDDGPLTYARFLRIFPSLTQAMAAAHDASVIHRDLKPHNVMVRERGGEIIGVKLLDFGIAKLLHEDEGESRTGDAMGTPQYMAPEQVRDAKHVDARADIYSFAATVFFALSGKHPIQGATVHQVLYAAVHEPAVRLSTVAPGWGEGLSQVLARCLAKEPLDRPASIREAWALIAAAAAVDPPAVIAASAPTGPALGATLTETRAPAARPGEASSSALGRTPTVAGDLPSKRTQLAPRQRTLALAVIGTLAVGAAWVVLAGRTAETETIMPRGAGGDLMRDDVARVTLDADVVAGGPPDAASTVQAGPADAAALPTVVEVMPVDAGTAPAPSPRRPSGPRPRAAKSAPAHALAPSPPAAAPPVPGLAASECQRARFAQVYQASAPTKAQVNEALRHIKACYEAGHIGRDDYGRIQAALIAKM